MGQGILIDTNVVVGLLEDDKNINEKSRNLILKQQIYSSFVCYIEALGWERITEREITFFQRFFDKIKVFQVDRIIIEKTIAIRREYKIKFPDAVIAATALVNNLTLATRNVKDFNKISGLQIYNPFTASKLAFHSAKS